MPFANASRLAVLVLVISLLATLGLVSTSASASGPIATASSQRAAHICAKRTKRPAALRRCMLRHASSSRDVMAPTVALKAPGTGATVKGKLQGSACEASASDDRAVTKVVFKVDGATLNTESDAPWNCGFETSKVSDGSHTVTATAYDAAGNASSASRSFTVSNAAAPAPAGTPEPTPTPAPNPTGMIVGLDAGSYGSSGASDVRGAVNTVRYDSERGLSALENFKKAGLHIQINFSGPYNSGGVCALNADAWVAENLAFYKTNTNPTQTPVIEALNEPGGTWFWGSSANSSANAAGMSRNPRCRAIFARCESHASPGPAAVPATPSPRKTPTLARPCRRCSRPSTPRSTASLRPCSRAASSRPA